MIEVDAYLPFDFFLDGERAYFNSNCAALGPHCTQPALPVCTSQCCHTAVWLATESWMELWILSMASLSFEVI